MRVAAIVLVLAVALATPVHAIVPAMIELTLPDGPTPVVVWIGDEVLAEVIYEGHPTECCWWFYPPGDPGGGAPDAVGWTATWTPQVAGQWLIQAQLRYPHEGPTGELYRFNAYLHQMVVDPMPFADGFETGDLSAWETGL